MLLFNTFCFLIPLFKFNIITHREPVFNSHHSQIFCKNNKKRMKLLFFKG